LNRREGQQSGGMTCVTVPDIRLPIQGKGRGWKGIKKTKGKTPAYRCEWEFHGLDRRVYRLKEKGVSSEKNSNRYEGKKDFSTGVNTSNLPAFGEVNEARKGGERGGFRETRFMVQKEGFSEGGRRTMKGGRSSQSICAGREKKELSDSV